MKNNDVDLNYSIISLGCARSLVDSENMVNQLSGSGFNLVPENTRESTVILNTCSFIQAAIEETEQNINTLIQKKKSREIKHVVVVGCYVSRLTQESMEEKFPEVDLWLSTFEESKLAKKLSEKVFKKKFQNTQKPYTKLSPSHYAYIKISEGCDNWCSFCTIPKIRGKHTSKTIEEVIQDAKIQIAMGAKELVLIAEDSTSWGMDLYDGKPSLNILLKELGKLPVEWIRLMYVYPTKVDDELIKTIQETPNILPYIDMPVQHVSSEILKGMQRRHDKDFLIDVIKKFKTNIPNLSLRTTFIMGFPGETDEHVKEIQSFITEYPFAQLGCFSFSFEEETRSARLPNQVDPQITKDRISAVMETQYQSLMTQYESILGHTETILYEGQGIARAAHQAPETDTITIIKNPENLIIGNFYQAKFIDIDGYDLVAEVI